MNQDVKGGGGLTVMEDDNSKASLKSGREDNVVFIQPENSSQRIR